MSHQPFPAAGEGSDPGADLPSLQSLWSFSLSWLALVSLLLSCIGRAADTYCPISFPTTPIWDPVAFPAAQPTSLLTALLLGTLGVQAVES